jgi:WD40 repeat protein
VKRPRYLRILLSATAGILTALALGLLLPLGPRAVLPAADRLRAVFFAPDGRSLVTLHWNPNSDDDEGAVILWDTVTGHERRRLYEGNPEFRHIAFSPDGRKLAGRDYGEKAQVHVWDIETGAKETVYWRDAWRDWGCTPIAFSPEGKVLVYDHYKDVMVAADTGLEAVDLTRRHGIGRDFRCTGMDEYVVFAEGKQISVVHLGTGKLTASFTLEGAMDSHSVYALTSDGKSISVTARIDGRPHYIFDARTCVFRRLPAADAKSWSALSPDRRWLIAGGDVARRYEGWRRFLPEWTKPHHKCASTLHDQSRGWPVAHFPGTTGAKFSLDGQTLALIGEDGTVQLWDIPLRTPWATITCGALLAAVLGFTLPTLRFRWRARPEAKP